jgi:glucose-6-phosphate 1-dehydrogenase
MKRSYLTIFHLNSKANSIFEPLWNRQYIDYIKITIAEKIGIEKRGHFYEKTGIIRDIVQNNAMQLIALIAMEPPVSFAPDYIRDEKVKIFHSIKKINKVNSQTVIGQYGHGVIDGEYVPGYRQEENVESDSVIPIFAGRFMIENWRWAGVPFYILADKRLPEKLTSIHIQFKYPPLQLLGKAAENMQSNALTLTIQPKEEIFFHMNVKTPGF